MCNIDAVPEVHQVVFQEFFPRITKTLGFQPTYNTLGDVIYANSPYRLNDLSGSIAGWNIKELPGCPGVAVFCEAWVAPRCAKKGLGTLLHEFRLTVAKRAGFSLALCTVDMSNAPQMRILHKFRWERGRLFQNALSGHWVGVFTKVL